MNHFWKIFRKDSSHGLHLRKSFFELTSVCNISFSFFFSLVSQKLTRLNLLIYVFSTIEKHCAEYLGTLAAQFFSHSREIEMLEKFHYHSRKSSPNYIYGGERCSKNITPKISRTSFVVLTLTKRQETRKLFTINYRILYKSEKNRIRVKYL